MLFPIVTTLVKKDVSNLNDLPKAEMGFEPQFRLQARCGGRGDRTAPGMRHDSAEALPLTACVLTRGFGGRSIRVSPRGPGGGHRLPLAATCARASLLHKNFDHPNKGIKNKSPYSK